MGALADCLSTTLGHFSLGFDEGRRAKLGQNHQQVFLSLQDWVLGEYEAVSSDVGREIHTGSQTSDLGNKLS